MGRPEKNWRTHQSQPYSLKEYSSLTTYKCKHKVTGRPICAVPCDGIPEMCENDADEQCDGPGLPLVLVLTFISSVVFLGVAIALEHITKTEEAVSNDLEMDEFNTIDEWYLSTLWTNLALLKRDIDYKKATMLATKYYENTALLKNMLCPRDEYFMKYLGTNKITSFYYDNIDGAISIRIVHFSYSYLPSLIKLWKKFNAHATRDILLCIIALTLRYSDLPKDILLLYIIWIQLVSTDSGMFSISIFWTLALSIVASELMHIVIILMNHEPARGKSVLRRLAVILACPIMPAIYLFMHLKLKLLQNKLLDSLSTHSKKKIKQEYQKLEEVECQLHNLELMSAKLHCNENVFENLTQLTILVTFILLSQTNSKTVRSVDYLFMKKDNSITIIIASMSLFSILKGQLTFLKANKNGCLGLKGTVITIIYFLIGTAAR